MNKIYYLAPSSDRPSWGLGIIYGHVEIKAYTSLSHGTIINIIHGGCPMNWLMKIWGCFEGGEYAMK